MVKGLEQCDKCDYFISVKEAYQDGYYQALEDFAEQFEAHCKKFTTKSISDADIDWVKNELKKYFVDTYM